MMKALIIFFFTILTFHSSASFLAAKVYGEVTVSLDGKAVSVKQGDVFNNKSIFQTGRKSFLSLKTSNGIITLKENTLTSIEEMPDENISFIYLIKGKIRSSINKEKGEKFKTIIRTKSVAIGVRGTDFITSFNDTNLSTGILGLDGHTEIIKIPDDEIMNIDDSQRKSVMKEIEDSNTINVTQGSFAQVFIGDSPIETYDVEPKQVELLSDRSITIAQNSSQGLVDLETNFFIPKDENAESIGSYDRKDGSYVPPEGLKLDPLLGFVNAFKEKIDELKVLQDKLNRKIEDKIFQIKELTSLGSNLMTYYQYSNFGIENHFERKRNIQKMDLHQFVLKGDIHHLSFKNDKYEWIPRVFGELYLNNHQKNKMARNYDKARVAGATQFKRFFTIFDRKANFKADISGGFIYKDLKAKGSLSYYASEVSTEAGIGMNFLGQKRIGFNFGLDFFETQESSTDVGHIISGEFYIDLIHTNSFRLTLNSELQKREQFFTTNIFSTSLKSTIRDIFRKTDLKTIYEFRKQDDIDLKLQEHLMTLNLERRKGPFLRYFLSGEYGFIKTNESLNPLHISIGIKGLF